VRVWVDQDLCTGDGLCTDHCPDVFMLLEDGLSYVRDSTGSACNDPGGRLSIVAVPPRFVDQAIAAALDCPGECIFLEDDETESVDDIDDLDIVDAELVDPSVES
jgi:ferredoxin